MAADSAVAAAAASRSSAIASAAAAAAVASTGRLPIHPLEAGSSHDRQHGRRGREAARERGRPARLHQGLLPDLPAERSAGAERRRVGRCPDAVLLPAQRADTRGVQPGRPHQRRPRLGSSGVQQERADDAHVRAPAIERRGMNRERRPSVSVRWAGPSGEPGSGTTSVCRRKASAKAIFLLAWVLVQAHLQRIVALIPGALSGRAESRGAAARPPAQQVHVRHSLSLAIAVVAYE